MTIGHAGIACRRKRAARVSRCTHTHTHTHIRARTHAHARTHTHKQTNTNTNSNTHTHTHIHTYTHTHIHTHTHKHKQTRARHAHAHKLISKHNEVMWFLQTEQLCRRRRWIWAAISIACQTSIPASTNTAQRQPANILENLYCRQRFHDNNPDLLRVGRLLKFPTIYLRTWFDEIVEKSQTRVVSESFMHAPFP